MRRLLVLSLLMMMGGVTDQVWSADDPAPEKISQIKDPAIKDETIAKDPAMGKDDALSAPDAPHDWVTAKPHKHSWIERRGPILLEKYDPPY